MSLYEDGKLVESWDGVSGADEFQNVPFKGPIPEGTYILKQSDHQKMTTEEDALGKVSGLLNKFFKIPKKGAWPGRSVFMG